MRIRLPRLRTIAALGAVATVVAAGSATAAVFATRHVARSAGGIAVHGRWTIKVYDRRHRLVRVRRFENSLQDTGKEELVALLAGSFIGGGPYTAGGWAVALVDGGGTTIASAATAGFDASLGSTAVPLTVAVAGPPTALVLTASAPAVVSGTIASVYTAFEACGSGGSCGVLGSFTARTLSPGVPVQTGQTISINVQFSFS
jgi:hypothetical protein